MKSERWRLYKTTTNVQLQIREIFFFRRSLTEHQLLDGIQKGNFFGFAQCDIEVPEKLCTNFAHFHTIFKNNLVSKKDMRDLMKTFVEKEWLKSYSRRRLISSFILQNEMPITLLLLIYLLLGLRSTKIHRFWWLQSREVFQQLCAGRSGRKNQRRPKFKLQCSRRDHKAPGQEFLWLPDYGPQPTHCNEVTQRQKNTCSYSK